MRPTQLDKATQQELHKGVLLGLLFAFVAIGMRLHSSLMRYATANNLIGAFLLMCGLNSAITRKGVSLNLITRSVRLFQGKWMRIGGIFFALAGLYLLIFQPIYDSLVRGDYTVQVTMTGNGKTSTGYSTFPAVDRTIAGRSISALFEVKLTSIFGQYLHYKISDPAQTLCTGTNLEGLLYKGKQNAVVLRTCDVNGQEHGTWIFELIPDAETFKLPITLSHQKYYL